MFIGNELNDPASRGMCTRSSIPFPTLLHFENSMSGYEVLQIFAMQNSPAPKNAGIIPRYGI
jgi:hypothetical protein